MWEGELEVMASDGFRMAYQTVDYPELLNNKPWSISIPSFEMDEVMKTVAWDNVLITISDDMLGLYISDAAGKQQESIYSGDYRYAPVIDGSSSFKHTTSDTVARGKTRSARVSTSLKRLSADVKKQLSIGPSTYKGIDNDNLLFIKIEDGESVEIIKPYLSNDMALPWRGWLSVNKKFISDIVKNITYTDSIVIESAKLKVKDDIALDMLIIQDGSGGHAVMPIKPVQTQVLRDLRIGDCFRIPGQAATFWIGENGIKITDGTAGESTLSLCKNPNLLYGYYDFSPELQVFYERLGEMKARQKRARAANKSRNDK
jgi:hypothetical protein